MTMLLILAPGMGGAQSSMARASDLERLVIDPNFPGVRQVEVADINGDGRPDVVATGGGTCAWYENPSWKKRTVTGPGQTPGIVSSASADMDGDGKAEIAIAFGIDPNDPAKGKLLLACQGKQIDDPWNVAQVADVENIHRLRWLYQAILVTPGSVKYCPVPSGRNRLAGGEKFMGTELLVASHSGPASKPTDAAREHAWPRSFHFRPGRGPSQSGGGFAGGGNYAGSLQPDSTETLLGDRWHLLGPMVSRPSNDNALRAIEVEDPDGDGTFDVLASGEFGVARRHVLAIMGAPLYQSEILVPGAEGEGQGKGADLAHSGRLKDGRPFLATVEPMKGTEVAVYLTESLQPKLRYGPRTLIDSAPVKDRALWVGDVDGDGDDEIFAGTAGPGIAMFDFDGKAWVRTVADRTITPHELRGGDFNGDGLADVVAVGSRTQDVVWFRSRMDAERR